MAAAIRHSGVPFTVAGHEQGFFLGATLFDHVKPEMRIYREEIFGPVLVLRARAGFRRRSEARQRPPDGQRRRLLYP